MSSTAVKAKPESLRTLPGDDVRQAMWRFADRYDLQMLVQSTRAVARLVAEGGRHSHEWTERKNELLAAYDSSGITAMFMEPEQGGFIAGPKNVAEALVAFELAWVDGGAATASLAGCLALSPIHERGTPEQVDRYMRLAVPPAPGEDRPHLRGAFCLTEPIPYVGVDTGMLNGKIRVAEWKQSEEPMLQVDKRGRFITNIAYANFVAAAVDTADDRITSSCMVILEEGDPGVFDRGTPTKKLVHQLSATGDPIFSLRVPASRIIGGYTIKDGKIVPNYSHAQVIDAVFRRTRVTVAVMTSAKLLSAVEPVIRYQRGRFRGAEQATPGTVRYELGLQQREDALQRLVDVWATGEASASLAFAAARVFDELDPLEREKDQILRYRGVSGGRAEMKAMRAVEQRALELLSLPTPAEGGRATPAERAPELESDPLVRFAILDAQASVLCPACKLWNTGHGANMMREAVSLMGGYGITEDCPGFLGNKWMDAQLEATYEGPECVQRRQLSVTMTSPVFLAQYRNWIKEMRQVASTHPGTGACTLATAMMMWLWTLDYLQSSTDADGAKLYQSPRQGVSFPLADALAWLLAVRQLILDVLELEKRGPENPALAEGLPGLLNFYTDLCHVQSARACGEAGRVCAELVFGFNRHPAWDEEGYQGCFQAEDLDSLEGLIPGIAACATDVVSADGSHPAKAGPCAACGGNAAQFQFLRQKLDTCLTGARLAKDRAAEAVSHVMIPEALDYPA